jgi:hypothetical protein
MISKKLNVSVLPLIILGIITLAKSEGEATWIDYAQVILAILGFLFGLYQLYRVAKEAKKRNLNEKRKYATDMIREWNTNSTDNSDTILKTFPGWLEKCEPITIAELKLKMDSDPKIELAIRKLLNYFEFVATAHEYCADRTIINESFALTMIRYCRILQNYLVYSTIQIKRNHWIPFTKYVVNNLSNEIINCNTCKTHNSNNKDKCFLNDDQDFKKVLKYLNTNNLTSDNINELKAMINL